MVNRNESRKEALPGMTKIPDICPRYTSGAKPTARSETAFCIAAVTVRAKA